MATLVRDLYIRVFKKDTGSFWRKSRWKHNEKYFPPVVSAEDGIYEGRGLVYITQGRQIFVYLLPK